MRSVRRCKLTPADSDLSGQGDVHTLTQRLVGILTVFLWLIPFCLQASIITNNNTSLVFFASSYDTSPYHYFGDYLASWVALGHPQFTNHWSSASRSGGSIEDANETRLERLGLAHWESGDRAIGLIMGDDDGGYTSNEVVMNLTNTLLAPEYFFNGYAYTNEGGWCSTQSITWVGIGAIPHDSSDGDSGEIARNNAVTNLFTFLDLPCVDMWHPLWTGGWSNDINSGAGLLGFYTGGHPYASGSLTMGITIAQSLADVDTNVSLATIDFSAGGVVCTNHCVISSISENGNSITFTRHDDRLPLAFDVPDGTITNDCRDAFIAMPQLSNAFWFTIAVTNLPAGDYNVNIDGVPVTTLSSSALATGWNMFTDWNSNSPYWKQRVAVLRLVRIKNGTDPVTLIDHSAGELGPGGWDLVNYQSWAQQFWNEGYRGDALVAALQFISTNLSALDEQISAAAQPTNHVFTIIPIQTITFPSPGDQTYGIAPITLNATASSGLPVVYSVISGPATVGSNILTITGAGTISIQASQPGNGEWAAASPVTQSITVAPASLTVSGITVADKVYDGTTTATVNAGDAALVGVLGSDDVVLDGTPIGVFSDRSAGVGKTVTITGLALTGANAGNYLLTPPTATANITPASTVSLMKSSMNPAAPGLDVIFTATLSPLPPGGGTPTGTVVFMDGAAPLSTNALDSSATASFGTSSMSRGNHTITAEYGGDGNFFGSTNSVNQLIDSQPVAGLAILQRHCGSGTKISFSDLLTNATDPDGDALTLLSVSATSVSGATILTNGQWVFYQPPTGITNSDAFSYIVADSLGSQSTGTVAVVIGSDTNAFQNLVWNNFGTNLTVVKFLGIPQLVYTIQYTTNLTTPDWQTLGSVTAADNGVILFFDSPPAGSPQRYYRTTYP